MNKDEVPKNFPIILSCNYGTVIEDSTHFNTYDKLGDLLLDYKLIKIKCQLISNKFIAGIQFIYRNINNGQEIALINIKSSEKDLIKQEMVLNNENIINLKVFLRDVKLIGFEVTTNKNHSKKFGYGNDEELINISDLENLDNVVVGFGVCYGKELGVSSLYFYYMKKLDYILQIYSGVLSLKVKLKDIDFKEKVEKKLSKMSKKNKLFYRICSLPNNLYFGVIKYALE